MSRIEVRRLARKLLMLGVLIASLAVLSADFGARTAVARPCCSACDEGFRACVDDCVYRSFVDPDFDLTACLDNCDRNYDRCSAICYDCG